MKVSEPAVKRCPDLPTPTEVGLPNAQQICKHSGPQSRRAVRADLLYQGCLAGSGRETSFAHHEAKTQCLFLPYGQGSVSWGLARPTSECIQTSPIDGATAGPSSFEIMFLPGQLRRPRQDGAPPNRGDESTPAGPGGGPKINQTGITPKSVGRSHGLRPMLRPLGTTWSNAEESVCCC